MNVGDLFVGTVVLPDNPTQAQSSAVIRRGVKAPATIGPTVDDSFLLMIGCRETLDLWDTKEHFQSVSFANELFLRRKFYHTCVSDGVDVQSHVNSLREESSRGNWVVFNAKFLDVNLLCLQ